jgi:hypothetical protein
VGDELADEGTEPPAVRDDRLDPAPDERPGGDLADRGGHEVAAREACGDAAPAGQFLSGGQPRLGPRRGGEGDDVDVAARRRRCGALERPRIGRRAPAVDGQRDDVGARHGEVLLEAVRARPVHLNGDPQAGGALPQEDVGDLRGGLRLGHPVRHESRRLDRAARLRAPGDEARPFEDDQQVAREAVGVGGVQPGPEPDPRRHDDDVRRLVQEPLGRGPQLLVVGVGDHRQRGRVPHDGAAPLERGAELLGAPVRRHHDRAAGEDGAEVGPAHAGIPDG